MRSRIALVLIVLTATAGCVSWALSSRDPHGDIATFQVDAVEPRPFPVPVEELNLSRQQHEVLAEGLRRAIEVGYWDRGMTFAEAAAYQEAYDAAFRERYPSEKQR